MVWDEGSNQTRSKKDKVSKPGPTIWSITTLFWRSWNNRKSLEKSFQKIGVHKMAPRSECNNIGSLCSPGISSHVGEVEHRLGYRWWGCQGGGSVAGFFRDGSLDDWQLFYFSNVFVCKKFRMTSRNRSSHQRNTYVQSLLWVRYQTQGICTIGYNRHVLTGHFRSTYTAVPVHAKRERYIYLCCHVVQSATSTKMRDLTALALAFWHVRIFYKVHAATAFLLQVRSWLC